MNYIFNMQILIEILIVLLAAGFQWFCGWKQNKFLGAILPIIAVIIILFLLFKGQLSFTLHDILTPFLLIGGLITLYEDGLNRANKQNN